jgi:hypothetical protein
MRKYADLFLESQRTIFFCFGRRFFRRNKVIVAIAINAARFHQSGVVDSFGSGS